MTKVAESTSQRLVSAVRKIAQEAVLKDGLLGPAAAKSGIGKTRGAAYYNANGDIESGSSVPGEAATDSADKSSAGNNGGSGSTKENLYTPIADADAAQVGDTFDQFEGYDCTTGGKIQLDLTPLPGAEYVPPDGWADADTPPIDATYEEGYYWLCVSSDGSRHFSMNAAKASTYSYLLGQEQDDVPGVVDFTYEYEFIVVSVSAAKWIATEYDSRSAAYTTITEWQIQRYDCGASVEGYCNPSFDDLYSVLEWPSDGITSLILKSGTLQAHSMDPDAAEAFKTNPPSEIEICDGQGNRYSVTALEGGGAMITKLDAGGDPIADGRSLIIDSEGVVTKRVLNTWREGYL